MVDVALNIGGGEEEIGIEGKLGGRGLQGGVGQCAGESEQRLRTGRVCLIDPGYCTLTVRRDKPRMMWKLKCFNSLAHRMNDLNKREVRYV